jgi:putative aminopeptidase FrvX
MELLKELCSIHATSGDESAMTLFVLQYIEKNQFRWKRKPQVIAGENFQESIILVFGKPKTAMFAHLDSHGFTARYEDQLVPIGHPVLEDGIQLWGVDSQGSIECTLHKGEEMLHYKGSRSIDRGTPLAYRPDFRETDESVQCCYLDNRLGVYVALQVAETLENGIIAFSCREEHGGGSTSFLARYIYNELSVKQTLICDITWVTEGVVHGEGVAISCRDSGLPRRSYVKRIVELAKKSGIPFQLEVEGAGGSDGNELQKTPYPMDWCFVGAPESNVHSPDELVFKRDIDSMIAMYRYLMKEL